MRITPRTNRRAAILLFGVAACAQPHEIDLAARPALKPDAIVTVWTHDKPVQLTAVTMTDDTVSGIPLTNRAFDTHRIAFAYRDVARVVVTQEPSTGSAATQTLLISALLLGVFGFFALLRHIGD